MNRLRKNFRRLADEGFNPCCSIEGWAAAAAIVGAGVVGAVGSNLAAGKQASADENAANQQYNMYNQTRSDLLPYNTQGQGAAAKLGTLLGTSGNSSAPGYGSLTAPFTSADYLANQDPGYQFQLQTGAQALQNSNTPGVGSLSGSALKSLMSFNQGMAATGYQNAFDRYQTQTGNTYNRLMGLASLGENAASQTGAQGTTLAGNAGAATAAGGAATASGVLGATSSLSSGLSTPAYLSYLAGSVPTSTPGNDLEAPASGSVLAGQSQDGYSLT